MRDNAVHIVPFGGRWCLWRLGAKAPYATFEHRAYAIRSADEATYTKRTRVVLHDGAGEVERAWFVGGRPATPAHPSGEYTLPRAALGAASFTGV